MKRKRIKNSSVEDIKRDKIKVDYIKKEILNFDTKNN